MRFIDAYDVLFESGTKQFIDGDSVQANSSAYKVNNAWKLFHLLLKICFRSTSPQLGLSLRF